jgi:hypothetical protein
MVDVPLYPVHFSNCQVPRAKMALSHFSWSISAKPIFFFGGERGVTPNATLSAIVGGRWPIRHGAWVITLRRWFVSQNSTLAYCPLGHRRDEKLKCCIEWRNQ